MSICFIDPADEIRAIADYVGREARGQQLDEHDISMLAAWHASMDCGHPLPNRDFLMGAFASLGEHRREALKLAAGFRGEEAVDAGVTAEDALELVLGL